MRCTQRWAIAVFVVKVFFHKKAQVPSFDCTPSVYPKQGVSQRALLNWICRLSFDPYAKKMAGLFQAGIWDADSPKTPCWNSHLANKTKLSGQVLSGLNTEAQF